jgi:RNA polymerase sigma-70 factor (ECF subfamily)
MGKSVTKLRLSDQTSDDTWVNWIRQVARGDESALSSFYDASSRLVYGLAFRILGDAGAAEEVALDVYLQVWREASRFDSARGRASSWLMAMTRSRAIDKLRVRLRELSHSGTLEALAETRSERTDPEESALITQLQAHVRRALNTLSDAQRQAIELAYFAGLPQSEIALKLNEPLGTIKTRIRNGMLKVREQLQSYEGAWR